MENNEKNNQGYDYRTTFHPGDGVFSNDPSAKSLTKEEAEQELMRLKEELLKSINSSDSRQVGKTR